MKKTTIGVAFLLLVHLSRADAHEEGNGQGRRRDRESGGEVYGTADDGTPLRWTVFPGAGPGPHPAVLVIHGGGFKMEPNSPKTNLAARDAAAAGFNAFQVKYRLASERGLPGQKSAGRFPDQTNDLKIAVRAARRYPGGNGKVGAIGGSAGGAHDVYLAATGSPGDDRLDAAVALSGAYDFTDQGSSAQRNFKNLVANYSGSAETAALQKASPITYVDAKVAPLFVIASDQDAMPPQQYRDLIQKLTAVGANFQQLLRINSRAHAFAYWPEVREQCLAFLKEKLGSKTATTAITPLPADSPAGGR